MVVGAQSNKLVVVTRRFRKLELFNAVTIHEPILLRDGVMLICARGIYWYERGMTDFTLTSRENSAEQAQRQRTNTRVGEAACNRPRRGLGAHCTNRHIHRHEGHEALLSRASSSRTGFFQVFSWLLCNRVESNGEAEIWWCVGGSRRCAPWVPGMRYELGFALLTSLVCPEVRWIFVCEFLIL